MNHSLIIPHEIGIVANYKFIRIPKDAIPQMVFDHFEGAQNLQKLDWYKKNLVRPSGFWAQAICQILRESKQLEKYGAKVSGYHNLVPSVLRNSLATLISGTTVTPTFKANYMALGSGSTAAANSDTQLGTETVRGLFTDRSHLLNIATLDKFFDTTEVGGNTYNEAGIFVDGSGSANSGYLLSRVLINETMGANETLTINATFTIT